MGRRRINYEEATARLPAGTLAKIDQALEEDEKLADFLRAAVKRELRWRLKADIKKLRQRGRR